MAEIIVEPTALSKVIPLKFKINDVDVPKTTQLSTNKQFNTTDTDAWFTFELDGLAATNGTYDLTLINLDDKSIFHHDHVLFPTLPFHYKLNSSEDVTLNEIRHAGRWLGQLVVTLSNGDTTARQFGFYIAGHILDGQDAQVILLSDYQALINTINLAKDDLAQYNVDYAALLVDIAAAEDARVTAYNQLLADQQANIEAFDVALDDGIVAANLATKLQDFEATNNSRLLSAEQQLEETMKYPILAHEVNVIHKHFPYGDIRRFGALCDTTNGLNGSDDTFAVTNAIASLKSGDTLVIPKDCKITNIVFNPPNYCNLICRGTIYSASSGIAFKIGDESTFKLGYVIQNLKIKSPERNWTAGRIGVKVTNLYDSTLFIDRVFGFENNLLIQGENNTGVSYNKFHLGRLDAGKIGIKLQKATGGWTNENSFYGGEIKYNGADPVDANCYCLVVGLVNNNHFFAPSFEGGGGVATSYKIEGGEYNQILYYRAEHAKEGVLDAVSRFNVVQTGYTDSTTGVVDEGQYNTVIQRDKQKYETQTTSTFIEVRNRYTNSAKYLSLKNTTGLETLYVKHTGEIWSNETGYFQKGIRWVSSDGTYTDRGIFTGGGSPEGVVTARPGSLYFNLNGAAGATMYVKESGIGKTGWVAK